MSRPASYHDAQRYAGMNDSAYTDFSLPLFNPQPPAIPNQQRPGQPMSADTAVRHYPPPAGMSTPHQQRHSIHHSPYNAHSEQFERAPPLGGRGSPPRSAGAIPPPGSAFRGMNSGGSSVAAGQPGSAGLPPTLPYVHAYPHHEDLLPPPATASSGLASLARSASLGTRKKDPYAYSSDDVESGMGSMDMRSESSWGLGAFGGGGGGGPRHAPPPQNNGAFDRDVSMSPNKPGRVVTERYGYVPPPAGPPSSNHVQHRPQAGHSNSSGSSPSAMALGHYLSSPSSQHDNPYLPRASDPGPSVNPSWTEARRPATGTRMPSSSSYHSAAGSDQLSPYSATSRLPGLTPPPSNPYETSPNLSPSSALGPPSSPMRASQPWTSTSAQRANSPTGPRPPPPNARSQSSHVIYPASQPATPAGKQSGSMGPPRGTSRQQDRSRGTSPARQGFREVNDWQDLEPKTSDHASGRRADPNNPGKYLSPLKCLTQHLPATYTLCNPQFRYESSDNPRRVLTKPSKPCHNEGVDNEDWDYILYVNDVLGGEHGGDRYLILDVLGQGTFGQVVKCQNMRTHDIFAVKVVKNKPAYLNQSKMEVAILDLLNNQYDPNDQHHILRMHESFIHKNHLCLVFECLSSNLYELIKQNQFKGLSTQLVKVFTQQLLECLAVLKDARLIHCDLKPENILLKSLQSPQIKVIDFGSACHEMQTVYTYIQSRFYRSPEVLLGLPYSTAIDMWSLGCIVVELFLGLPLFPGTSEYNQVSRIVDMLGLPPQHFLEVGKQTNEFFNCVGVDSHGRKQYQLKSMDQYSREHGSNEQPSKQYFKQTKLKDIIMEYPMPKKNAKQSDIDKEMATRRALIDFVEGLLNLDPIKRWSPQQAAKHPFVTGEKFVGPFQPPTVPAKKTYPSPAETPTTPTSKKYGSLVQSPNSGRQQRVYSDAAAYNQQLANHQSQAGQMQPAQPAQNAAAARPPFSPGYEPMSHQPQQPQQHQQQQQYAQRQRIPSHQPPPAPPATNHWQPSGPPPPQHRVASHSLSTSSSHSVLRNPPPPTTATTHPPPNSYYPASRNRANTINQIDAIPPALARLTHFGMPDPSGTRNLTPVLNRDDALREWERRQQGGHSRKPSMANPSYPQLEYLQEQAELAAAMGSNGWMMPGQYQMSGHRPRPSMSGQSYQMQPHISVSPTTPSGQGEYRSRGHASEYDPPMSAGRGSAGGGGGTGARSYMPTFPPPAATTSHPPPSAGPFDAFDSRDPSMGMMYTALQPSQIPFPSPGGYAGGGVGPSAGHQARASFSGPYGPPSANPFGPGPPHAHAHGHQQPGQGYHPHQPPNNGSPRNHHQRRSQQYGV